MNNTPINTRIQKALQFYNPNGVVEKPRDYVKSHSLRLPSTFEDTRRRSPVFSRRSLNLLHLLATHLTTARSDMQGDGRRRRHDEMVVFVFLSTSVGRPCVR